MTATWGTLSLGSAMLVTTALIAPGGARASSVHEIDVVASKFKYEPSTIQVNAGESVRLVIRSSEGTHGFAIPKLHIDVRLAKSGEPATVEFTAPSPGRYPIACSEFCGSGHGQMTAALVSIASVTTSR
jgi:cytochrome c oxidase subunit II